MIGQQGIQYNYKGQYFREELSITPLLLLGEWRPKNNQMIANSKDVAKLKIQNTL